MIPLYRAKKIDSDEYVDGYYLYVKDTTSINGVNGHLIHCEEGEFYKIDPSTLAIHFPDMICEDDEENEVKVFASLNDNGKGGDILEIRDNFTGCSSLIKYKDLSIMFDKIHLTPRDIRLFQVIGIQQ